jgi:hypothetical protein
MVEIKHNAKLPGNDDFILANQVEQVYFKIPMPKASCLAGSVQSESP